MGFWSQFKALFRKNIILWHRSILASLCELLFPLVILLLITWIRTLQSSTIIPDTSYLSSSSSYYLNENVKASPTPSNSTPLFGLTASTSPFTICFLYHRPLIAFVGSSSIYSGLSQTLFNPTGGNILIYLIVMNSICLFRNDGNEIPANKLCIRRSA